MTVYLINIALILFWRLFFAWKQSPNAGKFYCGIVALQWILISGLRSWKIGADTVQYFSRFEAIKQTAWGRILRNLFAYLFRGGNGKDPGYDLITKVFQLFSKNYQVFLLAVAVCFMTLMAIWIYENSSSPCTSYILFSTLFYEFYALTGHRQTIATALVVFLGYELMKQKRFWEFVPVALAAFLIHKSSLVFVPVYFLLQIPVTVGYMILCGSVIALVAVLGKDLYGLVAFWLGFDAHMIEYSGGGAELYATMLVLLCLVFWLLYPRIRCRREDASMLFHINALALLSGLLVFQNQSFMRIQQYFSLFHMITIPEVLNTVKREYRLLVYLLFGAFMIAYLIEKIRNINSALWIDWGEDMKVVQINAVCDTGSTGRICRELNDELIQRGHEGLILYGNGYSEYEFAHKVSGKYEVKLHGLLSRVLGKNAAYSPLSTGKIIGILKAYQPDIVHLGNLHGNYVTLKPLLRYLAKQDIPTVLTLHDCWFFTGKCTHYTVAGCNRWQTGCHHCPRRFADIPSWFFDRTEEMWREKRDLFAAIPRLAVIGVSDWITHEAEQSFLKEALIRQRIYNWVDLSVFYPRGKEGTGCVPVSEDKYSVLCVSAGWKQETSKTKDLLALAQLLPEDYEIILAGRVPFADKLPSNIKVVGYLSSAEALAKLYSACDVYVHLSREDTFGKVIAEALACGTPAVVYGSTACPEILGPGCGYAVDVGDVISVCQGIQRIRQKTKEAYSKCCTEYARTNFAKEKLVEDALELYKRLIGSK